MAMDELAEPGDRGRHQRPGALPPRQLHEGLPGLDAQHPPMVHQPPAVVGPPAPRLVPRPRRPTSAPSRRGARAGARSRRARHLVLQRAVAVRHARLAGADAGAARLLSHRRAVHRPRHHLPVGGAHDHDGPRVHGEIPFSDVYVHSIIQAPDGRRMSKSLGTGIDPIDLIEGGPRPPVFAQGSEGRPARRRVPRLRRRRRALGADGDVLGPGRALLRGQGRAGAAADQQALERLAPDPPGRGGAGPRGGPAQRGRGPVDALAAGARPGRGGAANRAVRLLPCGARRSTTSSTASCATGTWSWSSRGCAPASPSWRGTLLHVLTETIALAHPLIPFETEEIYSHIPGAEGTAGRPRLAAAGRRRDRHRGRAGRGAGDRRRAGTAPLARPGEGGSRGDVAGPAGRGRLRRDLRAPGAARAGHAGRGRRRCRDRCRSRAAPWRSSPAPTSIPARPRAGSRPSATKLRSEIERAEKKLSNQGFVAKAPPEVVAAERDKLERLRGELEAL